MPLAVSMVCLLLAEEAAVLEILLAFFCLALSPYMFSFYRKLSFAEEEGVEPPRPFGSATFEVVAVANLLALPVFIILLTLVVVNKCAFLL